MQFLAYILAHWQEILNSGLLALGAISVALGALYSLALLIPGEQPDKALKAAYDFTVRWSRKPAEAPAEAPKE